jgi:hypothetical protein
MERCRCGEEGAAVSIGRRGVVNIRGRKRERGRERGRERERKRGREWKGRKGKGKGGEERK